MRRTFLETSLEFYQDFVNQQVDDPTAIAELESVSQRVQRMVDELNELELSAPLLLLDDPRVLKELNIDSEKDKSLQAAVEKIQTARLSFGAHLGELDGDSVEAMEERLATFVDNVSQQLNHDQLNRLRQISRQQRPPYTFKTIEVVNALQLTHDQLVQISKIIDSYWPDRRSHQAGTVQVVQRVRSLFSQTQEKQWQDFIGKSFVPAP